MKTTLRRLGTVLALVLLVPELVHAGRGLPTNYSYWIGKTDNAIEVTAQTRFYMPNIPESGVVGSTEANREFPMPTTGRLRQIRVWLSGDVGAAGSNLAVTVRKNGADTLLTCTVTGATGTEAYCENIVNEAVFAKADRVSLQFVTTGTPAAVLPGWSLRFDPDATSEVVLGLTTTGTLASNVDRWWGFGASGTTTTDDTATQLVMPFAGRVVSMYVRSAGVIASGNRTVNLSKNGSPDSTLECILNNAAQDCTDLSGPVVFAAGDTLTAHAVSGDVATLSGVGVGILVMPDNPGEFPLMTRGTPSAAAINYLFMHAGGTGGASATESDVAMYSPPLILLRAFGKVTVAPGSAKSWAISVRRDLTTDTPMACTILDPATTCRTEYAVSTEPAQRMSIETTPTGTPAAASVLFSIAVRAR